MILWQWRIQNFLKKGANPKEEALTYYFAKIILQKCMKMKNIGSGGGHVPCALLDSQMELSDLTEFKSGGGRVQNFTV